jgi:hypothetical protein
MCKTAVAVVAVTVAITAAIDVGTGLRRLFFSSLASSSSLPHFYAEIK